MIRPIRVKFKISLLVSGSQTVVLLFDVITEQGNDKKKLKSCRKKYLKNNINAHSKHNVISSEEDSKSEHKQMNKTRQKKAYHHR